MALIDNRIKINRYSQNFGAFVNFFYLLDNASSPYFMWLGGHDMLPEKFIEILLQTFDNQSDCVLSYCPFDLIDLNDKLISSHQYEYYLDLQSDDPFLRVFSLISNLNYCTLVNCLFRTSTLKSVRTRTAFLGGDLVILTKAAAKGKFVYNPFIKYIRRDNHISEAEEERIIRQSQDPLKDSKENKKNIYLEMQKGQIEAMKSISSFNLIKKTYMAYKAKKTLIKRFGLF
jgi:glycosyltransferase involved in cell wall biosynthesis